MKIKKIKIDYVLDDQVGYLLRLASQRHSKIFQGNAPDGLTSTQLSALVRIAEIGECSQNRLGRLISMDVATIKGVVNRLKIKGLVITEPDTKDKRLTVIKLSKAAETIIEDLHISGRQISEETLRPLSKSEQTTLMRLLKKIS